jgi:hypothetical protein
MKQVPVTINVIVSELQKKLKCPSPWLLLQINDFTGSQAFVETVCGRRACMVCGDAIWKPRNIPHYVSHAQYVQSLSPTNKSFTVGLTIKDECIDMFPNASFEQFCSHLPKIYQDVRSGAYKFRNVDENDGRYTAQQIQEYLTIKKSKWDNVEKYVQNVMKSIRDREAKARGWHKHGNMYRAPVPVHVEDWYCRLKGEDRNEYAKRRNWDVLAQGGFTAPAGTFFPKSCLQIFYTSSFGYGEDGGRFHIHLVVVCEEKALKEALETYWGTASYKEEKNVIGHADIRPFKSYTRKDYQSTLNYCLGYGAGKSNLAGRIRCDIDTAHAVALGKRNQKKLHQLENKLLGYSYRPALSCDFESGMNMRSSIELLKDIRQSDNNAVVDDITNIKEFYEVKQNGRFINCSLLTSFAGVAKSGPYRGWLSEHGITISTA